MISERVPLELREIESGNFHLFVTVRIGKFKARLLLDTGASKTVFDRKRAERFSNQKYSAHTAIQSVGLGTSTVQTHLGKLSSIKFGALRISEPEIALLDLSHVNEAYQHLNLPEVDGVLGSDLLNRLQAEISYPGRWLKVKE